MIDTWCDMAVIRVHTPLYSFFSVPLTSMFDINISVIHLSKWKQKRPLSVTKRLLQLLKISLGSSKHINNSFSSTCEETAASVNQDDLIILCVNVCND